MRFGKARLALSLAALGLLLALVGEVSTHASAPRLTLRPREFVADARLAVTRVVAIYYAQASGASGESDLTPLPVECAGVGVIVGSPGANSLGGADNVHSYIMTDASVVNATQPCPGAVAAYLKAYQTPPARWKLARVTAYLNTAYTGADAAQVGDLSFDLDITQAPSASDSGPVALPFQHEPAYDLPVAVIPAAPPSGPTQLLDLGSATFQPYTADTITLGSLPNALTAIESGVLLPAAQATPTAAPTGTVTPAATLTPAPTATPSSTTRLASLGAPVISDMGDGTGQLAGLVVMTGTGPQLAGVGALNAALQKAGAASYPDAFASAWHAALHAYYAASPTNPKDPNFAAAAQQFGQIQQEYLDFHAVALWLAAARAGSDELGATSAPPSASANSGFWSRIPIHTARGWITAGVVALILLLGVFFLARAIFAGRRKTANDAEDERDITQAIPALSGKMGGSSDRDVDYEALARAWRATSLSPTERLPRNRRARRLDMQAAGVTDPGLRRKADPNQDSILVAHGARLHGGQPQPFGLFVVADGMGGHQNGREASMHTVQVMAEAILPPLLDGKDLDEDALLNLLRDGVQEANESLHLRNLRQNADMGTTVTAALVTGDIAHVVNVGDSRTYHLHTALPLRQVTTDHSVVASLVTAGVIHKDDIYTHPKRNQIYRSLGEQEEAQIDGFQVILQPGDHLLLCSDGLWEMIRDPRIEEMLRGDGDLDDLARDFVEEANDNGGVDNISVILVRMGDEPATLPPIGARVLAGPTTIKGI